MSESRCSELMWSHYGANHHGIVFGFSCSSDSKLANTRHCLPVTYAKEKPTFKSGFKAETVIMIPGSGMVNTLRVSFEDDVFRAAISTKTPTWAYEKEWRYVEESHGLFDIPGNLTEVVFGLRMSKERKYYYKSLIGESIENEVRFFETIETSNLDGLEAQEITH